MPSAVAGVIEISRCRRVITITPANAGDIRATAASPRRPPQPSEPPTMIDDARQRRGHRDPGARGHALAHQQPGEERGEERRDGLEQQHVRHARVGRAPG